MTMLHQVRIMKLSLPGNHVKQLIVYYTGWLLYFEYLHVGTSSSWSRPLSIGGLKAGAVFFKAGYNEQFFSPKPEKNLAQFRLVSGVTKRLSQEGQTSLKYEIIQFVGRNFNNAEKSESMA